MVNHVLQAMEGHFIRGYGDRTKSAEIYLLDGAIEEAEQFIEIYAEAKRYLSEVSDLIYGFETPYDLELLSTISWILKEDGTMINDKDLIVESMQQWSDRKKRIFPPHDIEQVRSYLVNEVNS